MDCDAEYVISRGIVPFRASAWAPNNFKYFNRSRYGAARMTLSFCRRRSVALPAGTMMTPLTITLLTYIRHSQNIQAKGAVANSLSPGRRRRISLSFLPTASPVRGAIEHCRTHSRSCCPHTGLRALPEASAAYHSLSSSSEWTSGGNPAHAEPDDPFS